MLDVNLGPALWLSQAAAPHTQRQGSGAIVHVTARPRVDPSAGLAAYGVSKAAVVHLVNHQDPVTTSYLPGGEPGPVAKARTTARGRARDPREIP
jgi:NAD(P)-dependent dehydrogenase (short-subunit alcohol dehydrogenase family)